MENFKNRQCKNCDACCFIAEVTGTDFYKPAGMLCPHLDVNSDNHKCKIFGKENRPSVCSTFYCSWMRGFGDENDRPVDNGVMVSVNNFNNGTWIMIKEIKKDAVITTGKNIILDIGRKRDIPIVVVNYDTNPPHDFGDRVIIKKSIENRSRSMMGKFLGYLDDDKEFGIYEINITNRTCENCVGCCIYFEIKDLDKKQHEPCRHLNNKDEGFTSSCENNCTIHSSRPKVCKDYFCQWVSGRGKKNDRPDKIGIMIDNLQGIYNSYTARSLWPGATETEKGIDFMKRFSKETNSPVIVINYKGTKITKIIGKGM